MKSPNPSGRTTCSPKNLGRGRLQALAVLDRMLDKATNKKRLRRALQARFNKDPVAFFKSFVLPFCPKEVDTGPSKAGVVIHLHSKTLQLGDNAVPQIPGPLESVIDIPSYPPASEAVVVASDGNGKLKRVFLEPRQKEISDGLPTPG